MKIDVNLVKKLVATQFPEWKYLEIRPVEKMGHDNRTFHLGSDLLVRLPSGKAYASQSEKEQKWLPYLQGKLNIRIPTVIGHGKATAEYPYSWSIVNWIDGQTVNKEFVSDIDIFARELAGFLQDFQAIDCQDGPIAGTHNFYRGGDLQIYDKETRQLLTLFSSTFDCVALTRIWEKALMTKWEGPPVWVHGDLVPSNMLLQNGQLTAIIDFGILGVGDPACDLSMYWTFFSESSRAIFKEQLGIDEATWTRAKGWVLWKTLLIYKENREQMNGEAIKARIILEGLVAESLEVVPIK